MLVRTTPDRRDRRRKPGIGYWRNSAMLARDVTAIVKKRDNDDEETITIVCLELRALARRILSPQALTDHQRQQLDRLGRTAKPSQLARTLQTWVFLLPDRTVRRLERDIEEARWA
jgi:hypothetical protein